MSLKLEITDKKNVKDPKTVEDSEESIYDACCNFYDDDDEDE